jgi:hypothetical protein
MTGSTLVIVVLVLYFLPTLIAMFRRHHNENAIIVCNLLLGWTVVGWIVALIWSFTSTVAAVQATVPPPAPSPPTGLCPHCGAARATGPFCPGCGAKLG